MGATGRMALKTRIVSPEDDLAGLIQRINDASWDDANDISGYTIGSLKAYLQRPDTVFVACHHSDGSLLGIASARIEVKPYAQSPWLYVDEVDVCVDKRRRGAGKLLMQALIQIATERGCSELWLGTEVDNLPANALYRSLGPVDVASVVGYTYRLGGED